jgi:hypothetical protein
VDGAGAVAGKVGNEAQLHKLDEVARKSVFNDVRAHGEDKLRAAPLCLVRALDELAKALPIPLRRGIDARGFERVDPNQVVPPEGGIRLYACEIKLHIAPHADASSLRNRKNSVRARTFHTPIRRTREQ